MKVTKKIDPAKHFQRFVANFERVTGVPYFHFFDPACDCREVARAAARSMSLWAVQAGLTREEQEQGFQRELRLALLQRPK